MRLIILLLAALATPIMAEAKRLELGFPGLGYRVQVVFPADYDPARTWPAILYYHGTNGKPDTRLIRHHTGENGWFTIGMTYVQQGKFTFTPESLNAELNILRSVRHHLATKYNVDPKRTYVAGFSKGGWLSGLFLQADPELAGAIILGAGHVHQVHTNPTKFRRHTPVFLGVGRMDGNYPFALRAVMFYRGLGATTTLDTWHDHAHQFPQDGSTALTQWLAIEAKPKADHRAAASDWLTTRLDEIKIIPDPVNRWVALLDLQATPYFSLLSKTDQTTVTKARSTLEQSAVVAEEAATLTAHRKLLRTEINTHSKENYQQMATAYLQLANSAPTTRQGDIARHDNARIKTLLLHFDEQEKIRKNALEPFGPEPTENPFDPMQPKRDRRIPTNPLVR